MLKPDITITKYPLEIRQNHILIAYIDHNGYYHCLDENRILAVRTLSEEMVKLSQRGIALNL